MAEMHNRYHVSAVMQPIDVPMCEWCAMNGHRRRVTHIVDIAHWYGATATTATFRACEKHARDIEARANRREPGAPFGSRYRP